MLNPISNTSPNPELHIATAPRRTTARWKNETMLWTDFIQRLEQPTVTPETMAQWAKMSREDQETIKDVGGFVGGWLKEGRRKVGHVQNRSLITLDADFPQHNLWDDVTMLWDFSVAVYSTHKYRSDNPRMRIIIPLSRPVTAEEYPAVARKIADELGMNNFDDSTYEPERLMFWPSHSKDAEYFCKTQDGHLLDPDEVLASYDNHWRDSSFWPTSDREAEVHQREAKQAGDPLTKPGAIGAFNRVYPIKEAIERFLPDVYAPTAHPDRYTYIPGSTVGGLVLYDDVFAYSHHGTDPTGGELTNAFDLVRLHKFNDLDAKTKTGTAVNKLPSYKAMMDFALKDKAVKAEWKQDVIGTAADDFDTWDNQEDGAEADTAKDLPEWLTVTDKGNSVVNTYNLALNVIARHPLFWNELEFVRYDPDTGIWRADAEGYTSQVLTQQYLRKLTKINPIRETTKAIQSVLKTVDDFPEANPDKIVLENGVYDWRKDQFTDKFDPKVFARVNYPVTYDPKAECPTFDGYLKWLVGAENVQFVWEWLGYLFYQGYPFQKMLFIYGGGGTGKSTLINIMRQVVGKVASAAVTLEAIQNERFAKIGLYQKTANFDSDAKPEYLEDGATLKTLTGEDATYADVKFGPAIVFRNHAKLTFSMNELPPMRDFSGGLKRRAMILKIDRPVTSDIKTKYPLTKINQEMAGIFNEAMNGLRRLFKNNGFTESTTMQQELANWIKSNDQVGRFVTDMVVCKDGSMVSGEDLYNAYTDYSAENGERTVGKYKFFKRLEDLGYTRKKIQVDGSRGWQWLDITVAITDFD